MSPLDTSRNRRTCLPIVYPPVAQDLREMSCVVVELIGCICHFLRDPHNDLGPLEKLLISHRLMWWYLDGVAGEKAMSTTQPECKEGL